MSELSRTNMPTRIGSMTPTMRMFSCGRPSKVPVPVKASVISRVLTKPMSSSPELTSGTMTPVPLCGWTRLWRPVAAVTSWP